MVGMVVMLLETQLLLLQCLRPDGILYLTHRRLESVLVFVVECGGRRIIDLPVCAEKGLVTPVKTWSCWKSNLKSEFKSKDTNTTFQYQNTNTSQIKSKKGTNTRIIPVNVPHWDG